MADNSQKIKQKQKIVDEVMIEKWSLYFSDLIKSLKSYFFFFQFDMFYVDKYNIIEKIVLFSF